MTRVADIMTHGVLTVTPDTPAEDAWERMRLEDIHHLVVTRDGVVVGLLSEKDIGGRRGAGQRAGRRVEEFMTAEPLRVRSDTPVRRAANLMRGRSLGALLVSNEQGTLTGIVTVSDLLEALGRGQARATVDSSRPALNHRAPHRKRHVASGVW